MSDMTGRTGHIRPFADLRLGDRPEVGGKCASLGELLGAGIDVPDGFAVTVPAFEQFRDTGTLRADLRALVRGADPASSRSLQSAHDRATALVSATPVPDDIDHAIREAYRELCRGMGAEPDALPVAVRSSAVAEDGDAASFAGQQETYLWVVGADSVVEHVRACWASLYTPQAIAYRDPAVGGPGRRGHADLGGGAGDGRRRGLGRRVHRQPPHRRPLRRRGQRQLGPRARDRVRRGHPRRVLGVQGRPADHRDDGGHEGPALCRGPLRGGDPLRGRAGRAARRRRASPTTTCSPLTALAVRIEEHYGCPQDIEWARAGDRFLVLQSRPETSWKERRAQTRAARPGGAGGPGGYLDLVQAAARAATEGTR